MFLLLGNETEQNNNEAIKEYEDANDILYG
jgi:hypothetical protein